MFSQSHRRRAAWIAILAILFNAFVPAMSQAVAAQLGITWLEICTKDGLKRIAVSNEDARPDLPTGAHVAVTDHCPYCAPHSGTTNAHLPPAPFAVPVVAGADLLPAQPPSAAPPHVFIARAHARAPPASF